MKLPPPIKNARGLKVAHHTAGPNTFNRMKWSPEAHISHAGKYNNYMHEAGGRYSSPRGQKNPVWIDFFDDRTIIWDIFTGTGYETAPIRATLWKVRTKTRGDGNFETGRWWFNYLEQLGLLDNYEPPSDELFEKDWRKPNLIGLMCMAWDGDMYEEDYYADRDHELTRQLRCRNVMGFTITDASESWLGPYRDYETIYADWGYSNDEIEEMRGRFGNKQTQARKVFTKHTDVFDDFLKIKGRPQWRMDQIGGRTPIDPTRDTHHDGPQGPEWGYRRNARAKSIKHRVEKLNLADYEFESIYGSLPFYDFRSHAFGGLHVVRAETMVYMPEYGVVFYIEYKGFLYRFQIRTDPFTYDIILVVCTLDKCLDADYDAKYLAGHRHGLLRDITTEEISERFSPHELLKKFGMDNMSRFDDEFISDKVYYGRNNRDEFDLLATAINEIEMTLYGREHKVNYDKYLDEY